MGDSPAVDFREVFEHSAIGAAIVGVDHKLVSANNSFCTLLGYSKPEIIELDIADFIHPEDLEGVTGELSRLISESLDPAAAKRRFVRRNRESLWAKSTVTLITSRDGRPLFIFELIDITESEKVASLLRESESRNRGLVEAAFDSISIIDVERFTIVDTNKATEEMLGLSRAELIGHNPLDFVPQEYTEEYTRIFQDLLQKGENRYRGIAVQQNSGRMISTEVSSRTYRSDGHSYLVAITRDITDLKEAEEALVESENRYHSIYASVPISIWEVDLTEIWRFLQSLTEAGVKDITGYLMENPELVIEATQKMRVLNVNKVTAGLFEADSKAEIMSSFSKIFTKDTYRIFISQLSALAMGLTASDEESTIVTLKGNEKNVRVTINLPAPYGAIDRVVVCVTDITELRRAERYQSRVRELSQALNTIDHALNSTHDIATTMQNVVQQALAAVACGSIGIALREGADWILKYAAGDMVPGIGKPLEPGHALRVELAKGDSAPWVTSDAIEDDGVDTGYALEHRMHSMMIIPLLVKDETVGAVFFVHHEGDISFLDSEVDFASKLATSISLALENARLYNEQLNIADKLQDSILRLPKEVDAADFGAVYHSATEEARVGGDFYDIFQVSKDKLVVVIGDVSGKGLEASALTSVIKNTIRAYAYRENSPASIALDTNELIAAHTGRNVFASLFVGVVNTSSGRLLYCNAGHPSPILKTPTETTLLKPTAPVLASVKYLPFREASAHISDQDLLILYTDGLTEARRGSELFGESHLLDLIGKISESSASEWPSIIVNEVLEFSGGRLTDDAAVLALQLKPTG